LTEIYPECVGCGFCCKQARCATSLVAEKYINTYADFNIREKLPDSEPECPFLYWDNDKYRCFLAKNEMFAQMLTIGAGCSSSLNSERLKFTKND
jgi:hypothetical protein